MSFIVEINDDECIGCGACAAVCPEIFEMVDGKAKSKLSEIDDSSCAKDASDGCPVSCIEVKEE